MFDIKPADAAPIWRQIEEGMRRLITVGALVPGAAVPSVRDLARDLRVNPATVSRAYQRLTDAGVLSVKRGDGTYVADEPAQLTKSERHGLLRDAAAPRMQRPDQADPHVSGLLALRFAGARQSRSARRDARTETAPPGRRASRASPRHGACGRIA